MILTENMKKLFEFISKHPEFQSKVTETADQEQIISFAAEHGITLTKEDFEAQEEDRRIDKAELAAAAGGKTCVCVVGGGGESSHPSQGVCACPAIGMGFYDDEEEEDPIVRCYCVLGGGGDDSY